MSQLKSLTSVELQRRLHQGLRLASGPFVFNVSSAVKSVAAGLGLMYAESRLVQQPFADFHVRIDALQGIRRFYRPQAQFWLDGYTPFKPLALNQAYAMLEWGMNWSIANHAHYYLMLHAAVLERNGMAVVMPGDPGAGKSTLTAALMLSGWRLLSDEIALIDRRDGRLRGLARPVSLKNASIDVVRAAYPDAVLSTEVRDTHKGTVAHLQPTTESVRQVDEPVFARWVIFPRWREHAAARLTPHPKAAAFLHLANHAFNYSILGTLGFRLTAALMDACSCWDFEYGRLGDAIALFGDLPP